MAVWWWWLRGTYLNLASGNLSESLHSYGNCATSPIPTIQHILYFHQLAGVE